MGDIVRRTGVVVFRAGLFVSGWLGFCFAVQAGESLGVSVRWNTNSSPVTVEVLGVSENVLRQMTNWETRDWQKLLSIYAGEEVGVPPMLGTYAVEGGVIRFTPRFSLERGVTYCAVLEPGKLPGGSASAQVVSIFKLRSAQTSPTTVVSQIYPSADVLPENLLKFYVHFSAPMQGGHIYDHVNLRNETGKAIELPFLEIDEELWNPEMTRVTLLIDPGRIKRGVKPLVDIGPALEEGKRYSLEIDADWRDNNGSPLKEAFRKSFRVGAADRVPPTLETWKVSPPKAGTRDALSVTFPKSMDHALALRMISVANPAGKIVKGTSDLSDHEQHWSFVPESAWVAGTHQLQVENTIEDLAGNNIGKAFDVDLFEGVQRRFTNTVLKVTFEVR